MKRKWLNGVVWLMCAPLLVFVLLMVLLYVPPVQNFLRRQATAIASEATGLDIEVARIDLRFPLNLLVRDVQVVQRADSIQRADTLLRLGSLNAHVQVWPLVKGLVEIDEITLRQASVNSADLLEGMCVRGELGEFTLESHGVDLNTDSVTLNRVRLADTHLQVSLADTTQAEPDTTATGPLTWKVCLHAIQLSDVSVDLVMPLDSMRLTSRLGNVLLEDALVDLERECYAWRRFLVEDSEVDYDSGSAQPAEGFDASHIALRDIRLGIDSVLMHGRNLNAVIREFSLNERSGLNVTSMTGRFHADSTLIQIPSLKLNTPHSEVDFAAQTYWQLVDIPTTGRLTAHLHANIGKQDVLLFAGGLPESFKEAYPFRPLTIRAGTIGNLKQMQLSRFAMDLPGAFSLRGDGELWHLTDSLKRSAQLTFDMQTQNLNFLAGLTGVTPDGSIVVPDSMQLQSLVRMEGPLYTATVNLRERQGTLNLSADYNTSTDAYHVGLSVDSLQVHHFLPKDSIYTLSTTFTAEGRGTDLQKRDTWADLHLALNELQYGSWHIANVTLDAGLKEGVATARVSSKNPLLDMQAAGDMQLGRSYLDGSLNLDVHQVDLCALGLLEQPLEQPFAFRVHAKAQADSIGFKLNSGDLSLTFRAGSTLQNLLDRSDAFMQTLTEQIEVRRLDHAALRRLLPSAGLFLQAGQENPVSEILTRQNIGYEHLKLGFAFTPRIGINGRSTIEGVRFDSILIDTLFFDIRQDTTRMRLQSGVVNAPGHPHVVFRSTLTGEIRNEDAELTLNFTDAEGETGILFGLNARPLTEGHGKGNGLLFSLIPENPVIAYRRFSFAERRNKIYLHKNMHVYANVDMTGDDGIGFRMLSDIKDTVSLQNINIALNRFKLSELSRVLPYMPRLTGLFSAKAHYVQTEADLRLSADASIDSLTYEGQHVGNIGADLTWLPRDNASHFLNTRCSVDGNEVLTTKGFLTQRGKNDSLRLDTRVIRLPLSLANAFVPGQPIMLDGHANGKLLISGRMDSPQLQGSLSLDTASVLVRQMGAKFWFDTRPVRFERNKMVFDKFSIYTTNRNPFTIDGSIDLADMDRMSADLRLNASNYTLLDAPRTRESLVYGKVCVDVMAFVRGPLDALVMRGNMNLLGNTDVTYVLTNSPLTVENRLDGLVTFTSFADTASAATDSVAMMSLGGMDMLMTVHIDDAVRLRADLSADRSKFVELQGGGDLSLQYPPQGNMSLSGRYTLSGGVMKYSLPIIPLKEFHFTSGSYVDWRGDMMNPTLDLKATERVRAAVSNSDDGGSRMVDFDVSISISNRLSAPELVFDISAPEDATVENELQTMGAEERSKQAIAMLATGIYLNSGIKGGGLNMGTALNSVLQNQINALAGSALQSANASFSVGVEDRTAAETGDKQTDYSFRYSQRFFNDRVQIVIGGRVSTGANATNDVESFIDNISLEYRLDNSGTRYVRVFHDKNYDSILDGEITETGVGLVLRRKMDRLGELFLFRRKKEKPFNEESLNEE